jgi:hypothetical protein
MVRNYVGRRHTVAPIPAHSRADRFFWRGFRWGWVAGALPWFLLGFAVAAALAQLH